ncbi:hypothetical protein EKO27_g3007 [Xylaria grammica]|uniref:Glucose-methanol-choline oxidoreductase N-terminal domain-containing protein n=1 Tax=Xylaria grammica TaxID=363999 RepID=A0A439DCH3_9PEZI|nr:hypothetical protein EKO27_g3007 [Xylaria grammica]
MLLGGSSAINAQVFASPTKNVIDAWESLGNLGWNWDTLQRYFYKSFTLPSVEDEPTKKALGIDKWPDVDPRPNGPVQISFSGDITNPIRRAWVETFAAKNLRMDADTFFGSPIGVGAFNNLSSVDSATKERSYSASAYYLPIKNRDNLTIVTSALVEGLVFSAGTPARVEGVRYHHDSEAKSATTNKEEPDAIAQALGDYAISKTGLLTSCGIATCAYLPLIGLSGSQQAALQTLLEKNAPSHDDESRDAYSMVQKAILSSDEPCGTYLSVNGQGVLPVDPVPGKWMDLAVFLSRPLSRGHTHIQSKDPNSHSLINPAYLSHPADLEVFAHHMLYIQTLAASPPLTSFFKQPLQHHDPASDLADLEAAKRYIQRSAISIWHPCGTCAMLPREKGGVVDALLKVYGVENLRVVDASVMPLVPNTNIQATVYAVAERAADLIKAGHELK